MRRDAWQAIADPTRRKIIEVLHEEPLSINGISEKFKISRPAISKQVKILHEAQLIEIKQKGRQRECSLAVEPLQEIYDWVQQYEAFWHNKLDKLDNYLNKNK